MDGNSIVFLLLSLAFAVLAHLSWTAKKQAEGLLKLYGVLKDIAEAGQKMGEAVQDVEERLCAVEDARSREDLLGRANMLTDNVNVLVDDVQKLRKELEGIRTVNNAEHHALLEHQKCIVKDMKEKMQ